MKSIVAIIFIGLFLQGCVKKTFVHPAFSKTYDREAPKDFNLFVQKFINHAKNKELDMLVASTSKNSNVLGGSHRTIRELHEKDTIPALSGCNQFLNFGAAPITAKESGTGSGWVIRKKCLVTEDEVYTLYFSVLIENSKKVMSTIAAR